MLGRAKELDNFRTEIAAANGILKEKPDEYTDYNQFVRFDTARKLKLNGAARLSRLEQAFRELSDARLAAKVGPAEAALVSEYAAFNKRLDAGRSNTYRLSIANSPEKTAEDPSHSSTGNGRSTVRRNSTRN